MKLNVKFDLVDGPTPAGLIGGDYDRAPEVTFRGEDELDLPDEGILTLRYKLMDERESNRPGDAPYTCTIAITELVKVKAEEPVDDNDEDNEVEAPATSGSARETDEALDKYAKEYSK